MTTQHYGTAQSFKGSLGFACFEYERFLKELWHILKESVPLNPCHVRGLFLFLVWLLWFFSSVSSDTLKVQMDISSW